MLLKATCENGVLRVSDETIREAIDEWTTNFAQAEDDMLEALINQFKVDLGKLLLDKAWTETCIEMGEMELSRRQAQKTRQWR